MTSQKGLFYFWFHGTLMDGFFLIFGNTCMQVHSQLSHFLLHICGNSEIKLKRERRWSFFGSLNKSLRMDSGLNSWWKLLKRLKDVFYQFYNKSFEGILRPFESEIIEVNFARSFFCYQFSPQLLFNSTINQLY